MSTWSPSPVLQQLMKDWKVQEQASHRVIAFGSSNTELWWHNQGRFSWACWLTLSLRAHVGKQVSVTNMGVCGHTSADLLKRMDRDVFPFHPAMTLVTIGGNDLRHMSLEQYRANLREIVSRLRARGIQPVLQTYYSFLEENPEPFTRYMTAEAELARELDVPCIDQYPVFHSWHLREPEEYKKIMLDPNHLNPLGNALFGTWCVRAFGLPDPTMPEDIAQPVADILRRMEAARS